MSEKLGAKSSGEFVIAFNNPGSISRSLPAFIGTTVLPFIEASFCFLSFGFPVAND